MLSKVIFIYTTNISNTQTHTYTHNIFNHNKHRDRKKSRAASLIRQHHLKPRELTIWWTLKQRSFLILTYNVCVQIGLICALSAILPLYMDALGYTFQETAAILSMFLFSGISGVLILAPATDRLQDHLLAMVLT